MLQTGYISPIPKFKHIAFLGNAFGYRDRDPANVQSEIEHLGKLQKIRRGDSDSKNPGRKAGTGKN